MGEIGMLHTLPTLGGAQPVAPGMSIPVRAASTSPDMRLVGFDLKRIPPSQQFARIVGQFCSERPQALPLDCPMR